MVKLKELFRRSSVFLCITALLIPSLWQTHKLWLFGSQPLVGPFNPDVFADSFAVFRNYRIVLNPHLGWLLSFFYTYLNPFLLVLGFLLFRTAIAGRGKTVIALAIASLCIPIATSGTSAFVMATWLGSLLLIIAQVISGSGIKFWAFVFMGLIVSLINNQLSLIIFWTIGSVLFAETLHFFFVDRMQIKWRSRLSVGQSILQIVGWGCLTFSSLLISVNSIPENIELAPSPYAWGSWIILLFSLVLTWIDPWKSQIWMRASIFPWLLYFSPLPEKAVFILGLILLIKILQKSSANFEKAWIWSRVPLTAFAVIYMAIFIFRVKTPERSFDLDWIKTSTEIAKYSPKNLLVLSNGIPYLAQTSSAGLVFDPNTMLMINEKDLLAWMAANEVDHILIERSYFLSFWKDWLLKKQPAELSNKSVISRIMWYKGEAISTSTLKTPAIESLKLFELESTKNFVVIAKK